MNNLEYKNLLYGSDKFAIFFSLRAVFSAIFFFFRFNGLSAFYSLARLKSFNIIQKSSAARELQY